MRPPWASGILRARYLLQNAALLEATEEGDELRVARDQTTPGISCPAATPRAAHLDQRPLLRLRRHAHGRVGAYAPATGILTHDSAAKIYEVEPEAGRGDGAAARCRTDHRSTLVLNNKIFKDKPHPTARLHQTPPYADFAGAPVGHT